PDGMKFGVVSDSAGLFEELGVFKERNQLRTLASPTLVTSNGAPAQYVEGGEAPLYSSSRPGTPPEVTYKTFGRTLTFLPTFLPTVLPKGKIHLETAVLFSKIDVSKPQSPPHFTNQ